MSDLNAAPAADATPTTPEPGTQAALNALTPEDRTKYDLTGEWPSPAKVTTTAAAEPPVAAAPAEDDDEPPAADAQPAQAATPAAAAPAEKPLSKRQQQINDLIRRSTEADLRAKALEAEIAALKGKVAPTEPAKPSEPKAEEVPPTRPKPTAASFETWDDYTEALTEWKIEQIDAKRAAEAEKAEAAKAELSHREAFVAKGQTWIERRDTFAAKTPEFSDKAMPFLDRVYPNTPIGDVILESEVGPQIALHLATHPDEAERIARLAPVSALRALGKLEALFDSTLTSASASAGPAAKTVTSAPAPPTTLASRSATPADPSAAALAAGDFAAWEAEENRKAVAAGR